MAIICPAVLNDDMVEFESYFSIAKGFAKRIHLDIMDGSFTDAKSVDLAAIKWPSHYQIDIHLMVAEPMNYIDKLIELHPHMVIVHNEANVHHMLFAAMLHQADILSGLALLQDTPVDYAKQIMHSFDHVLIFSGDLGHYGGTADLSLLSKVNEILDYHPGVEIGWDGGVNPDNLSKIALSGVDVINVGSAISRATNPKDAYDKLEELLV